MKRMRDAFRRERMKYSPQRSRGNRGFVLLLRTDQIIRRVCLSFRCEQKGWAFTRNGNDRRFVISKKAWRLRLRSIWKWHSVCPPLAGDSGGGLLIHKVVLQRFQPLVSLGIRIYPREKSLMKSIAGISFIRIHGKCWRGHTVSW